MNPTSSGAGDDQALAEPSDDQIIDAVRAGDIGDFALLWRRHVDAARRAARAISPAADPDDLVSESFASILRVIKSGGGPSDAFRPYLLATLRNTAARWARGSGVLSIEVVPEQELASEEGDPIERISERSSVADVFGRLSARHRTLLWYLEVEGMKPRELAPLLGITPNAVSALALRARDSFRRAWLEAHIHDPSRPADCRWFCERIVAKRERPMRGDDIARFRDHMAGCPGCQLVAAEIDTVSQRLRSILPAALLGGVAAGVYSARDETPAAAHAAPPEGAQSHGWLDRATAGRDEHSAGAAVPAPPAPGIGMASQAVLSASVPVGGLIALTTTAIAVVGMVAVAVGALNLPDMPADGGASSVVEVSGPADDPLADVPVDAARPPTLDPPASPHEQPLLTGEIPPGAVEGAAPPAPSTTLPTHPSPSPPGMTATSSPPRDAPSGDMLSVDEHPVDAHGFRISRSIAQDSRVPARIQGMGRPGATVTVFDDAGIPVDAASVDDAGAFFLDVSGERLHQGMSLRVRYDPPQDGAVEWAEVIGPLFFAVPRISIADDGRCGPSSAVEPRCLLVGAEPGSWVELLDSQGGSRIVPLPPGRGEMLVLDAGSASSVVAARYIDPTGRSGVSVPVDEGVR